MSETENLPFEIFKLSEEDTKLVKQVYGNNAEFVQVGEKKWLLPESYIKYGPEMYNFPLKPDDIWLMGFQRSGTTVVQEIVWLLNNDLNFDIAKQVPVMDRFPSLEHILLFNPERTSERFKKMSELVAKTYKRFYETQERRFIKVRLPMSLLPQNLTDNESKIIYMVRDPREIIASCYNLLAKFSEVKPYTEFSVFWKRFKQNLVLWGPFFEHLKEAWELSAKENVLILFYDDIINNQKYAIKKLATFFEKIISEENVDRIFEYCKNAFDEDSKVDHKQGKVFTSSEQKWKKYFVNSLEKEVDDWIKQNIIGTNIHFSSFSKQELL